ncbi:MAG: exodeoxyribonuclease VII large subunit [Verrucomicrobiaceae bacterium]|nr:exodeoxyribonuclease VII large subunit [Verrucomicrobiaceae bacterium]
MAEPESVLTVSQLTRRVRALLEGEVGEVWVEGEISNHRVQSSGHQYFTLKDEGAQLSCVMFRYAGRVTSPLKDGAQVQVYGKLSVYEPRGQYQLVAKLVQGRGVGALQARFEALKQRLAEEGLFDQERKQPIPKFPSVVALVTSPTGAAIQDMLNILARRAPWIRVLVFPVRVQGVGAEVDIAAAIKALNDWEKRGLPKVDCMVVGRGGGSLEDLWNFNEELVARAIHESDIPVISAVGHEIDFTIADFVADLRAPTPSAAAELMAPDGTELRRFLDQAQQRLGGLVERHLAQQAQVLALISKGSLLHTPQNTLQSAQQALDEVEQQMLHAANEAVRKCADLLQRPQNVLARFHPVAVISEGRHRADLAAHRLTKSIQHGLSRIAESMESKSRILHLLGPEAVLARGFSYTTDENGKVLTDACQVSSGKSIQTQLASGKLTSVVK